jgi:serine protease Do
VVDAQGLKFRLGTLEVGGEATLSILRRGKPQEITFRLISRPSYEGAAQLIQGRNPLSGARVANLTEELADDLNLTGRRGVVITGVRAGSIAQRIGLQRRDLVLGINGQSISDVNDVYGILRSQPSGQVRWQITVRRDRTVFRRRFNLWR